MKPKLFPRMFLCDCRPSSTQKKKWLSKCNFLTRSELHEYYVMSHLMFLRGGVLKECDWRSKTCHWTHPPDPLDVLSQFKQHQTEMDNAPDKRCLRTPFGYNVVGEVFPPPVAPRQWLPLSLSLSLSISFLISLYRYIYICCEVIIWSKFGPFGSYYLVQVCFFLKHRLPKNTIKIGVSALFFWNKKIVHKNFGSYYLVQVGVF